MTTADPAQKSIFAHPILRALAARIAAGAGTLIVLAYLTLFGLIMAERGLKGLPADPVSAAVVAVGRAVDYFVDHPAAYFWRRASTPALELVGGALVNSAGLLVIALGLAALIGIPVGIVMALPRRFRGNTIVLLLSVLAISTPSFLLAMLLWILNAGLYQNFGMTALPSAGFGWDNHVVLPVLVLAGRPLAQFVQVTYVSMQAVMDQDFVRTARGKGLREWTIVLRHALRNALIPIVTTFSTNLRFSLSSLPVVEFFFSWPGVGLILLQAIDARNAPLVTDLVLSLGFFFLVVNSLLEVTYAFVDPRLSAAGGTAEQEDEPVPWRVRWQGVLTWLKGLFAWRPEKRQPRPVLDIGAPMGAPEKLAAGTRHTRYWVRAIVGNPALMIGTVLVALLLGIAVFGEQLTTANPYQTHGLTKVDGDLQAPPFKPSPSFPWGSDPIGRDIQALVFAGAKQTLALALFGTMARVVLGTVLGMTAAWARGKWFDRLVIGAVGVWAAFPATLFAMILIVALGIQQGMSVFVMAVAVVGWGEIAQTVRGLVSRLRNEQFVQGAQAVGSRTRDILLRHILPNLVPSLVVIAVLEFGGVLMLLAELAFLNVFMGGGFKVEVTVDKIYAFSDVPEWGALLANIRTFWRSYPWLAWYPGLFFFLAILTFNLWGEGLRRFLDTSRVNISRLFNRLSLGFGAVLLVGLAWVLQSNTPVSLYAPQAKEFQAARAMQDARALSSLEFRGREAGSDDARRTADYIATRMQVIGLFPAGDDDTFIQTYPCPVYHLTETPILELLDGNGKVVTAFEYRREIVEMISAIPSFGENTGRIVGLQLGPDPGTSGSDVYGVNSLDLDDKFIIVREERSSRVPSANVAGMLVIPTNPNRLELRFPFLTLPNVYRIGRNPTLYISPQAADRLLQTAGSSLIAFDRAQAELEPGKATLTNVGAVVHASTKANQDLKETCYSVIGHIPGTGAEIGGGRGKGLDSQVILVGAYYDGAGTATDGAFHPGANDNASGVAEMLEIARVAKQGAFQPDKTLVFAAWCCGERLQGFSIWNTMNAKRGFGSMQVEAILELSGVGAGSGNEISLGSGTSYKLVQLYQQAAGQFGIGITTRGRSPHFALPLIPGFGGRSGLSAYVSWDGSDANAHTTRDTVDTLDPAILQKTGETNLLVLTVLSREVQY